MLELAVVTDDLTKRFGEFTAVDGINLQVAAGTVVSLLGPNGAGKTTIVRMLATLSEPTSGSALVCGHDVVRDADAVRSVISLTGQFAALEANLTAHENLVLVARLRGFGRGEAAVSYTHLDVYKRQVSSGRTSPGAGSGRCSSSCRSRSRISS